MKKTGVLCLGTLLLAFSFVLECVGAENVPFKSIFKIDKQILIPAGEPEAYSDYFEVPALPAEKGMTAVLKLNFRHMTKGISGWNPWGVIEVNGQELEATTAKNTPRLLLRGNYMQTTRAGEENVPYWKKQTHSMFMCLAAPADTNELDPRIVDRANPYVYYFDIDDIASKIVIGADDRVENDKPNRLRFANALPASIANVPLLVKDIEIGYVQTSEMARLTGVHYNSFNEDFVPAASIENAKYTVNVSEFGGLQLVVDSDKIYFEADYSYAAEPEMKYNRMTIDKPEDNYEGVTINVEQADEKSAVITMNTQNVKVVRTVTDKGHLVNVVDVISNVSGEDIGLIWKNEVSLSGTLPETWRISGITSSPGSDSSTAAMTNPTVYVAGKSGAAGCVVEDTVSRVLLAMRCAGNVVEFFSKGVGLPKDKSLTVEWSIYPLNAPENGYFDMVNQIREDWNVNVTVPGPYLIRAKPLPGIKVRFASVAPWFEYERGVELSRDEYKEIMTKQIADLRKEFPGIRLMALLETNLVNFDASKVPWGDELPLTYGDRSNPKTRYAQYLTPELTKKLDAATPFADSLLRDKDGNAMIDTHYVYEKKPWINLMPQPEEGNYRFKHMMDQIRFVTEEVGFEGVYIDQFNPTFKDGVSYNRWDGYSIKMDKTGKITEKMYNYAITGATARMKLVKSVTSKGGDVLTNGHPVTREEQSSGRLSFAEMENDACNPIPFMDKKPPEMRYQAMGHLASPIILNLRPHRYTDDMTQRAVIMTKGLIIALRNGVLPYYYGTDIATSGPGAGGFEIANWMFPFTPVKLGEGVLVGKERTLVCVSGTYKVGGANRPSVAHFDDHSLEIKDTNAFTISGEPGNWTVDVKLKDWCEIASIVVND